MYEKVSPNTNFVEREKKTEKFWKENGIFEKSIDQREAGDNYTFYDGPPTANGKPHIGHVLTRVIKDGNTKACGRISPQKSDTGSIWTIRISPTTTTSSNPSGGR